MSWSGIYFESHPEALSSSCIISRAPWRVSRCFDVVSRLLLITPLSDISVDTISYLRIVAQKYRYQFFASYA